MFVGIEFHLAIKVVACFAQAAEVLVQADGNNENKAAKNAEPEKGRRNVGTWERGSDRALERAKAEETEVKADNAGGVVDDGGSGKVMANGEEGREQLPEKPEQR